MTHSNFNFTLNKGLIKLFTKNESLCFNKYFQHGESCPKTYLMKSGWGEEDISDGAESKPNLQIASTVEGWYVYKSSTCNKPNV